jgi:hypothetical protein
VPNLSLTYYLSGGYPMLAALNVVALAVPLVVISLFTVLARAGGRKPREIPATRDLAAAIPMPEGELV